jgi:hypothetical protein
MTSLTRAGPSIPVSTKRKTYAIHNPPASNRSASHIARVPIPHILGTPHAEHRNFKSLIGTFPKAALDDSGKVGLLFPITVRTDEPQDRLCLESIIGSGRNGAGRSAMGHPANIFFTCS